MSSRKLISNSGPLIHLSKAGLLELIGLYDAVIPVEVKYEVVDKGKEKGFGDAVLVEKAIENGLIRVVNVEVDSRFLRAAKVAGLHKAEIAVIYYAHRNSITALLDEDAARTFARALGVTVRGSLGVLIEGLKRNVISYSRAVEGLNRLSEVMYLSSDIYRLVLKELKKMSGEKG